MFVCALFLTKHQHCLLTGTVQAESNRVFFKTAFVLSQPLTHVALEGSIRIPPISSWRSMFLTLLHVRITRGDFFFN